MRLIPIHKGSPDEDWRQLHNDVKNPELMNPEKTHRLIAIDFETSTKHNEYLRQAQESDAQEYERKMVLYRAGKLKTKPTKKNRAADEVPFDFLNMPVMGVAVCCNFERSYYINFGHSDRDGLSPVCSR